MKRILILLPLASALLLGATSKQDDKTGLIWQDNEAIRQHSLDYEEAVQYCKDLTVDGFGDWRVPALKEAYSIVDLSRTRPALKNGFEIRDDFRYWTATPFAADPQKQAWIISIRYGEAEPYNKGRQYHVRCVRDSTKR